MRMKAFTIYDTKAKAYLPPFFLGETGQAVRHFTDAVNDGQSAFNKHPEDYTLFEIGGYDDATGLVNSFEGPELVCTALQCVASKFDGIPELTEVGAEA